MPPAVEALKRELADRKVMLISALDTQAAVSGAHQLLDEVHRVAKKPARSLDLTAMVQRWSVNKDDALADYEGAMQYPILLLYYAGNNFWRAFLSGYRVDELQCWLRWQLTNRVKRELVTIVAGNPELSDYEGVQKLFGYSTPESKFVYAIMDQRIERKKAKDEVQSMCGVGEGAG